MIKIEFEDCKGRVNVSCEATGNNHELAPELATLITERNTIIMKIITERPSLAPLLYKYLEQEGYHEQND